MSSSRAITIFVIILALLAAGVAGGRLVGNLVLHRAASPTPMPGISITISGEPVCLPHRDTSGPQTLECAIGLKTDDGTYYHLTDSSSSYAIISKLQFGQPITVTGVLVTSEDAVYQASGTITVSDYKQ